MIKTSHICDICGKEVKLPHGYLGPRLVITRHSYYGSGCVVAPLNEGLPWEPPYNIDLCNECLDILLKKIDFLKEIHGKKEEEK